MLLAHAGIDCGLEQAVLGGAVAGSPLLVYLLYYFYAARRRFRGKKDTNA